MSGLATTRPFGVRLTRIRFSNRPIGITFEWFASRKNPARAIFLSAWFSTVIIDNFKGGRLWRLTISLDAT